MTRYKCNKCGWSGKVNGRLRCLECNRRRVREWRKKNPEKYLAQKRRYDKKMRTERRDEYNAKRRRTRSSESNAKARNRRISWLSDGDVTRQELINIYESASGKCNYCNTEVGQPRFTTTDPRGFDHVVCRSRGGKHTAKNIVVCCRSCNEIKGDKNA